MCMQHRESDTGHTGMPKSQESWSEEEALLAKLLRQFWKNFAGIAAEQRIQEEKEQDEDEGVKNVSKLCLCFLKHTLSS